MSTHTHIVSIDVGSRAIPTRHTCQLRDVYFALLINPGINVCHPSLLKVPYRGTSTSHIRARTGCSPFFFLLSSPHMRTLFGGRGAVVCLEGNAISHTHTHTTSSLDDLECFTTLQGPLTYSTNKRVLRRFLAAGSFLYVRGRCHLAEKFHSFIRDST